MTGVWVPHQERAWQCTSRQTGPGSHRWGKEGRAEIGSWGKCRKRKEAIVRFVSVIALILWWHIWIVVIHFFLNVILLLFKNCLSGKKPLQQLRTQSENSDVSSGPDTSHHWPRCVALGDTCFSGPWLPCVSKVGVFWVTCKVLSGCNRLGLWDGHLKWEKERSSCQLQLDFKFPHLPRKLDGQLV